MDWRRGGGSRYVIHSPSSMLVSDSFQYVGREVRLEVMPGLLPGHPSTIVRTGAVRVQGGLMKAEMSFLVRTQESKITKLKRR
jgi:hypothetical protein